MNQLVGFLTIAAIVYIQYVHMYTFTRMHNVFIYLDTE